jgi:hypothetical protein
MIAAAVRCTNNLFDSRSFLLVKKKIQVDLLYCTTTHRGVIINLSCVRILNLVKNEDKKMLFVLTGTRIWRNLTSYSYSRTRSA